MGKGYYQRSHLLLIVQALIGTWASFRPDKEGASLGITGTRPPQNQPLWQGSNAPEQGEPDKGPQEGLNMQLHSPAYYQGSNNL